MKVLSFLFPWYLLLVAHAVCARGSCSPNDNHCQDFSGQCTTTIDIFLEALSPDATFSDIRSAVDANTGLFKYGRYCGSNVQCHVTNGTAPAPCNAIDAGCEQHYYCLETKGNPNDTEGVGFPDRCECDIGLVASMILNTPGIGVEPTDQLCDQDFYELRFPEAATIAFPFCQTILHPASGCNVPRGIVQYCAFLFDGFLPYSSGKSWRMEAGKCLTKTIRMGILQVAIITTMLGFFW